MSGSIEPKSSQNSILAFKGNICVQIVFLFEENRCYASSRHAMFIQFLFLHNSIWIENVSKFTILSTLTKSPGKEKISFGKYLLANNGFHWGPEPTEDGQLFQYF